MDSYFLAFRPFLDMHFKSASCASVLVKHIIEFLRVLRVNPCLDLNRVLVVASAATVVDCHCVRRIGRTESVGGGLRREHETHFN